MKRKIGKVKTDELFEAIGIICKEYNEKHKTDPIVSFSGHFELTEKTKTINIHPEPKKELELARERAEDAMSNLQKIEIE